MLACRLHLDLWSARSLGHPECRMLDGSRTCIVAWRRSSSLTAIAGIKCDAAGKNDVLQAIKRRCTCVPSQSEHEMPNIHQTIQVPEVMNGSTQICNISAVRRARHQHLVLSASDTRAVTQLHTSFLDPAVQRHEPRQVGDDHHSHQRPEHLHSHSELMSCE